MASGPGLLQISGGGEDEILEAIDQIDQSLRRSVQAGQVLREPGNGSPGEATDSCGDAADSGSGGEAGEAGATGGSADDDELLARYFEDCSIFGDALKFRCISLPLPFAAALLRTRRKLLCSPLFLGSVSCSTACRAYYIVSLPLRRHSSQHALFTLFGCTGWLANCASSTVSARSSSFHRMCLSVSIHRLARRGLL